MGDLDGLSPLDGLALQTWIDPDRPTRLTLLLTPMPFED